MKFEVRRGEYKSIEKKEKEREREEREEEW